MEKFVANAGDDGIGIMPTKSTPLAFGFDKSLADTPRTMTIVTSQQIEAQGIANTEDLVKVAPSTFTSFRFGIQGNLSIRGQTSDFYFRGMRRIDPQGNFATRWGAFDSLDIIAGPASSIYGLGRIGGYVNFNPKTGRAESGKYLDEYTGEMKVTYGSYDNQIIAVEIDGPLKVMNHDGGLSLYGYIESDGSPNVANRTNSQKLFQGTYSVDITKSIRAEMDAVLQNSYGAPNGGDNRTLRDTIETKTYWSGSGGTYGAPFSYHLDENGDGVISDKEVRDSYFWGTPQESVLRNDPTRTTANLGGSGSLGPSLIFNVTTNDPFDRVIPWQGGLVNGGTITLQQFQAGYLDTAGPGMVGKAPIQRTGVQLMVYPSLANGYPNTAAAKVPFWLPPAFDLDPSYNWQQKPYNKKMSLGETFYRADPTAFFFDIINDYNPEQTWKNQIFVDGHHQIKYGENYFTQRQFPLTFEDKVTFQRKFNPARWWSIDFLASTNVFMTWVDFTGTTGDYDWRRDLQRTGQDDIESTFTPQDRFASYATTANYATGQLASSNYNSQYQVYGAGTLLDQTFFNHVNLIMGYRYDYVNAAMQQPPGVYERASIIPTSDPYYNSGLVNPNAYSVKGNSSKPSMNASITFMLPFGLRPYATVGQQAVIINSASNGGLNTLTATQNDLTGSSTLLEAGLKGSMLKDKLFFSFAGYDQTRSSFDVLAGDGAGAVSSTVSRGWETQVRFLVTKNFSLTANGNWSSTYSLGGLGNILVSARDVGFPDVVDSSGKVIIPAEAFGWGGRLMESVPSTYTGFRKVPGTPNHLISSTAAYNFTNGALRGWYASMTALDQGSYSDGNLLTIHTPEAWDFDSSIGYRSKKWELTVVWVNMFNRAIYGSGIGSPVGWIRPTNFPVVNVTVGRKF